MEEIQNWFADLNTELIMNYAIEYGTALIGAIAIFMIGKWVARRLANLVKKMMERGNVDPTITGFLSNIIYYVLFTIVIIAAIGTLGVETTSLAAVIAAAGLAIGLALQGSLSNLAAGVMIVLFRPFQTGDFVKVAGIEGTVEEINIFTSYLKTPDNRTIIVPNGKIIDDNIINFTAKPKRRIDLTIGVGYDDDLKAVKKLLSTILDQHEKVLKTPEYIVAVSELADSSVNFVVRPWVKAADYWDVRFELTETIKNELDNAGFSIPFPQRDVHHYGNVAVNQPAPKKKATPTKKKAA